MPFFHFFKRKHFLKCPEEILAAGYTFFILDRETNKVNIQFEKLEQERNLTHK